ncbi:peptidoglycan-binding protein [Streptomyces sp. CA-210063]|uniref:peptidoglycan-binding protein n=1 Tax=Streptomyces sp. CA-210063 TaxID=2801029 RepID=UPI00214D0BF1|nr:peptidoglycan-binding protein [Streptomyces sp. CA-210063]UUU31848.1 peptidoglycan-binding protein [Streptomyces sp. CA-210063]
MSGSQGERGERGGPGEPGEQPPEVALAQMLRRWWEQAGKPPQVALARKVGVAQATLSRYLNPHRRPHAPVPVIELLHRHLEAPGEELERARELQAALKSASVPGGAPDPEKGLLARLVAWFRRATVWRVVAVASVVLLVGSGVWWAASRPDPVEPSPTGTSTPVPAVDWQLVQEGARGWRARTVQHLLVAQDHEVDVDGIFGPKTKAAVKAFQSEHGLTSDGKVGERTWPVLVRVDTRVDGDAVKAIQELLDRAGRPTDVTGRFTRATVANLSAFQEDHGLPVTGEADAATWRALMDAQPPDGGSPSP